VCGLKRVVESGHHFMVKSIDPSAVPQEATRARDVHHTLTWTKGQPHGQARESCYKTCELRHARGATRSLALGGNTVGPCPTWSTIPISRTCALEAANTVLLAIGQFCG